MIDLRAADLNALYERLNGGVTVMERWDERSDWDRSFSLQYCIADGPSATNPMARISCDTTLRLAMTRAWFEQRQIKYAHGYMSLYCTDEEMLLFMLYAPTWDFDTDKAPDAKVIA